MRETRPSSAGSSGASTATTPVGSGTVKLKYGPATGFELPSTCASLSAHPAYQTTRSIATSTSCRPEHTLGEVGGAGLHHLCEPVEDLAAVVRGRPRPGREGRSGSANRVARVLARGARHVLTVRLERAPGLGARELATDEELVRLLDRKPGHRGASPVRMWTSRPKLAHCGRSPVRGSRVGSTVGGGRSITHPGRGIARTIEGDAAPRIIRRT